MNSMFHFTLLAAVGLGAARSGCQSASSQGCTPFPPPSSSGAACTPLASLTLLRPLGDLVLPPYAGHDAFMTADDTAIYFPAIQNGASTPSLYRMPKAGGPFQLLDEGAAAPIVVDGPFLVYTRLAGHPQSGGYAASYPNIVALGSQCLYETFPNPSGVNSVSGPAVDATGGVSWLASGAATTTAVLHWDPATNATSQLATSSQASSIVGDADHVYWSAVFDSNWANGAPYSTNIMAVPSAGGSPAMLATFPGMVQIAAVDDDSLYIVASPQEGMSPLVGFTRISKTDGSKTATVAAAAGAGEYAVLDSNVYWSEEGSILRTPKSGGAVEVVVDLGDEPSTVMTFTFDACNVYLIGQQGPSGYAIWGQGLPSPAAPVDASAPEDDASADATDEEPSEDASAETSVADTAIADAQSSTARCPTARRRTTR